MDEVPDLVQRARALARELGFPLTRGEAGPGEPSASLPGVGRFLAVLAAGCRRIGEMGAGTGIGTAWLASAMPDDCVLVTGELDERRAAAAAALFAGDPRVEVVGDVTPLRALPGGIENAPAHDARRELFFGSPQLVSAEVVLPDLENSLLVGTKLAG
jgi:predicted O-methyltransferase YrrM